MTTHPKTREIHAPDFTDRVVHHYLVPQLQSLYEPIFIHDSYANREGKGTHQAVARLQQFMRQIVNSPTPPPNLPLVRGSGYYLQLDIHNFFNSLHRGILYQQLKQHLAKSERKGLITAEKHLHLKTLCHALVNQKPAQNTIYRGSVAEHAQVPAHKRLLNAKKECGIAVGNLSSQFFANVYLNALDQFVKHTLKCQHYVRYVDDFVLLHNNPQQLLAWRERIAEFLAKELALQLKCNSHNALPAPQAISDGCDFLGYVIYPQHKIVRDRVIKQCRKKLREWSARYFTDTCGDVACYVSTQALMLTMQAKQDIRALVASYWGHFSHANHWRLTQRLLTEFYWLRWLFIFSPQQAPQARFACNIAQYFAEQVLFFQSRYPQCHLSLQKGFKTVWIPFEPEISSVETQNIPTIIIRECGVLKNGLKRREVTDIIFPIPLLKAQGVTA